MAEYIDRQAAQRLFADRHDYGLARELDKIPAADVVEVVHGRNMKSDTPSLFECSVCGWCSYDTLCSDTEDYNYCPNCGARMDGD